VIPSKSEELWAMLRLPGSPATTRGASAEPRFGASPARELGEVKGLFPRIELPASA
jgi:hypothetical protein